MSNSNKNEGGLRGWFQQNKQEEQQQQQDANTPPPSSSKLTTPTSTRSASSNSNSNLDSLFSFASPRESGALSNRESTTSNSSNNSNSNNNSRSWGGGWFGSFNNKDAGSGRKTQLQREWSMQKNNNLQAGVAPSCRRLDSDPSSRFNINDR